MITVRSSDFAKFTGHNPYCKMKEATDTFWTRNSALARRLNIKYTPQKWSKLETQLANSSKSEISTFCDSVGADTIKDACEIVKKNVIVPAVKSDTNALVTESIDKNTANIPSAFVESIKQDVQISRGIKREKDNIENFESKSAMIVTEQNSQIFEKKITIWKQHEILLVGKVDGISKDENECDVIIEVKERRNRLFNALVDYEKVQLHCYMVLTDIKNAILIERFDDETNEFNVTFDNDFWNECLSNFSEFLEKSVV
tara:strand:+ start:149 stop:922 length:774 start_codon:yes stop_codon:yes gene_type:complete